jgi:hypothetical protein
MKVHKVENPKHQNIEEIKRDFWDNWLIVRDITWTPRSGTVIFYCRNTTKEFWETLAELDQRPSENGYPDMMFVGPSRGFMGGLF